MVDQMPVHGNSRYSQEVAARVCELIANGATLNKAGSAVGVKRQTIIKWVSKYDDFANLYAQARKAQLEAFADEVIDLSDEAAGASASEVQAAKLRTDNRKWLLSKLAADVYGDKLDVTSKGEALAAPSHMVDARVQSIVMQAALRMAADLGDEAQSLLE